MQNMKPESYRRIITIGFIVDVAAANYYLPLIGWWKGARGGAVGWGIALQAGRSRSRFPMRVFIFNWLNPSGRTMTLGSIQPLKEMTTRNIFWGKGGRCVGMTTLPPWCADCLEITVASTSWNPTVWAGLFDWPIQTPIRWRKKVFEQVLPWNLLPGHVSVVPCACILCLFVQSPMKTATNSKQNKLREKLTGPQLVEKFHAFYGTKGSLPYSQEPVPILNQIDPVHPPPPSHFSNTHFNIILQPMPGTPKWSPSSDFPTKPLHAPLLCPTRATTPYAYVGLSQSISLHIYTYISWMQVSQMVRHSRWHSV